jgi:hypothetical protein
MNDTTPAYVSIVFAVTTVVTVSILFRALQARGVGGQAVKVLYFIVPLWLVLQGWLSMSGFYQITDTLPPRLILFGILPALVAMIGLFVFARDTVIDRLPMRALTWLHLVRIPVEIVLYWLSAAGLVPRMMTFEGANFDIASGVLAVIVSLLAFRRGQVNRLLLTVFNIIGLLLLANIVSIAAMSLPSPMQQLNFDAPNRGVLIFPYIWLPTIVVPIVLFSHLAALWQLFTPPRTLNS